MSLRVKFWLIMLLAVVTGVLAYPREYVVLHALGLKKANLHVEQGLDLQGGAYLVFQADFSKTPASDRDNAMSSLISVMEKRANPSGTSEISVTQQGSNQVAVELPGVTDINDAINRIGRTANLTFLELPSSSSTQYVSTGITGKDVSQANPDIDTQTGQPVVELQMKGSSVNKFSQVTTQINQEGGRLVALLDNQVVFGPATVSQPITDGNAQLSGNFSNVAAAKEVAEEINAGALPVPVNLVQESSVGPTLGKQSIAQSLVAGIIGLAVVAIFMISYYRVAGLLAVFALIIYTFITLTIYKLSALTPYAIVLTLAGTAGFILSIGMAVDANILIFERTKEELRYGKAFLTAVETGFDRAWTSIRDSNVSTLITCVILYLFGASIIRGFAVTLGLGVLISMFTSVVISRTFLRLAVRRRWGSRPAAFGLKSSEVPK
ncbi:MAG TPA: protein translocase subunit SecD [Candidatus Saccharimonadales bacterium]|nr:protein translocase subunit SecD [Candidatus Saccharimonadales bacterium]